MAGAAATGTDQAFFLGAGAVGGADGTAPIFSLLLLLLGVATEMSAVATASFAEGFFAPTRAAAKLRPAILSKKYLVSRVAVVFQYALEAVGRSALMGKVAANDTTGENAFFNTTTCAEYLGSSAVLTSVPRVKAERYQNSKRSWCMRTIGLKQGISPIFNASNGMEVEEAEKANVNEDLQVQLRTPSGFRNLRWSGLVVFWFLSCAGDVPTVSRLSTLRVLSHIANGMQ